MVLSPLGYTSTLCLHHRRHSGGVFHAAFAGYVGKSMRVVVEGTRLLTLREQTMKIVQKRIADLRPGEIVIRGTGQAFKVGTVARSDRAPETHTRVWDEGAGVPQLECTNDYTLTVVVPEDMKAVIDLILFGDIHEAPTSLVPEINPAHVDKGDVEAETRVAIAASLRVLEKAERNAQ